VNQHAIRSSFSISLAASQCLFLAQASYQCLGARYDQHAASGFCRSELSLKFGDGHKFLTAARAEAAVFWEGLVLHDNGRDTGRLIAWYDIGDVHGIAETCVDVGDDRGILHFADRAHHFQVDVHRKDIGIGHGVGRGQLKATTPYRIETSTGGELGRERVVSCHRHRRPVDIDLGTQHCHLCAVLINVIIPSVGHRWGCFAIHIPHHH
jgi:hypothetical protein